VTSATAQLTPSPTYNPPPASSATESSTGTPNRHWSNVLGNSLWFYDAQRSGRLDQGTYGNRVEWRNDSCLDDGSDWGIDLTGGWFDAGDVSTGISRPQPRRTISADFTNSLVYYSDIPHGQFQISLADPMSSALQLGLHVVRLGLGWPNSWKRVWVGEPDRLSRWDIAMGLRLANEGEARS
jgi:hypothetical protein